MKILNLIGYNPNKHIIYKDFVSYDLPIKKGVINLINGLSKTVEMFGDTMEIDFMGNQLDEHIYWCYSNEESISKHQNFINQFLSEVPELFVNLYKIKHIDIGTYKEIYNKDYENIYISNKYIFYGYFNKDIYVCNLLLWHYFGLDVKVILNKLNTKNIYHDKNNVKYKKYFNLFDSHLTEKIILLSETN